MVQRKVYVFPLTPLNVDVGFEMFTTDPPTPEIMLHAPVPTDGVFAASVTDVKPHVGFPVWSGPAFDTVVGALMLIAPETFDLASGLHDPLTIQ
jgi:hypothetical protein